MVKGWCTEKESGQSPGENGRRVPVLALGPAAKNSKAGDSDSKRSSPFSTTCGLRSDAIDDGRRSSKAVGEEKALGKKR